MTRTVLQKPNLGQSYEDFTTYVEVDGAGRLTVDQNTITVAGLTLADTAYIYKDMGAAGIVNGDFIFDLRPRITANAGGDSEFFIGLWDDIGDYADLVAASKDGLLLHFYQIRGSTQVWRVKIRDIDGGVVSDGGYREWTWNNEPCVRFIRRGSRVMVYNFSDNNFVRATGLHANLTQGVINSYRYFYAFQSHGGGAAPSVNATINDLTIRPARYQYHAPMDFQTNQSVQMLGTHVVPLAGNVESLETTSPGWRELSNQRWYDGGKSVKAWSDTGGASGRVRTYNLIDYLRDVQGSMDTIHMRLYSYLPSDTTEYVVPLTFYSNARTEYLMWLTIYQSAYVSFRRYYPTLVSTDIPGFIPPIDKWMYIECAMHVDAVDGWYRCWYSDALHKWKPELIHEETGLDTSGATDFGDAPKIGITHFGTGGAEGYFYFDEFKIDENFIGTIPRPKYPIRLQAST